jgi:protein NirF
MKKFILVSIFLTSLLVANDKIFVVERSNSALAVINHHRVSNEIKNMHNFNHAVVKFKDKDGYVITRDGYVIKFDPEKEVKLKEYRTSKSAIGFIIGKNFLAVANYDNKTVEIVDRDLNPVQSIKTNSRNVGIKLYKNYLIFECMDTDQIWVMKNDSKGKEKAHFTLYKKFKNVGKVPFDAMINKNLYVSGFFNSPFVGVLNLDNMKYRQVKLDLGKKERILKVPHFGFWSISKGYFFIPAVGNKKVFVFDHKFNAIKSIRVLGNPVFTSLSPSKKYLAVTFSGKDFPRVQIIDTKTLKVIKTFRFKGMVLHVRWATNGKLLYVSVNGANEVEGINVDGWWKNFSFPVPKPSGIFIYKD